MFSSASIRHINAISLYVQDIARSKAFYTQVFEAQVVHETQDNIVIKFDPDGHRFELAQATRKPS